MKFNFSKLVKRKVGLDTDVCLSWFNNQEYNPNYKSKISRKKNSLYINHIIFRELMGLLKNKYFEKEGRNKIFAFLRKNKINFIKKSKLNLTEVNKVYSELQNNFKNHSGINDLMIMSIFYISGMDCILSNNIKDFEEPCRFLNIPFEESPVIEIGSIKDVNRMLKDLYPFKFKRKY